MAAPKSSLTGRLQKLEAAQARADKLKRGTRLSAKPMAELLGVTWTSLKDWCDEIAKLEASGAVVRGGNGVEWSFEPKRAIKILIDHFKGVQDKQAKKSREVSSSVGLHLPEDEAPSLAEAKDLVRLTLDLTKAAVEQEDLVPKSRLVSFVGGYNQEVVEGILGGATHVDPNGNLPPHVKAAVDQYLRQVALHVHSKASKFLGEFGASLQQEAVGRAG